MFIAKNIKHAAYFSRRRIQDDYYHYAVEHLRDPSAFKFWIPESRILAHVKLFMTKQFRKNMYKRYADYGDSIKKSFIESKKENGFLPKVRLV